jgi:DNA gyrase subunit B
MPELITRGHIYIAQPPLYKVTRGRSEQYLKDERALEDYLIGGGLDGATLRLANGEERGGEDLREILEQARAVRGLLDRLHSRYDRDVVEQAAIAGALSPAAVLDEAQAEAAAAGIAARLDVIADEVERGWEGRVSEGGFVFSREVRGVREAALIDGALINSLDARRLNERAAHLHEIYGQAATLHRRDDSYPIHGPVALLEAVLSIGRKGVALQRYKGLGEMNPGQLWETTLDINARSLLQVRVREDDDTAQIFSDLMGDVVEPRRDFIQQNALSASVDA